MYASMQKLKYEVNAIPIVFAHSEPWHCLQDAVCAKTHVNIISSYQEILTCSRSAILICKSRAKILLSLLKLGKLVLTPPNVCLLNIFIVSVIMLVNSCD